jgi:hypothetical protein
MNVIDNILNEWSFRCHDGIVDLNDPVKLSILEEIYTEIGLLEINVDDLERISQEEDENIPSRFETLYELVTLLKSQYKLSNDNFKISSANELRVLLPKDFSLNRKGFMDDILQNIPDTKFEEGSIGARSSLGNLKFKNKVRLVVKSLDVQGEKSAGKSNEAFIISDLNKLIDNQPTDINIVAENKTLYFPNIIKVIDASQNDTTKYAKADLQLVGEDDKVYNISLKQDDAIRWESSITRYRDWFDKFIQKAKNGELGDVGLKEVPGTGGKKFKLWNIKDDKVIGRVIVKGLPEDDIDEIIFGSDKSIVVIRTFSPSDIKKEGDKIIIKASKIYENPEQIRGTNDEPILALGNHVRKPLGIELRVFTKWSLYRDEKPIGSNVEINYNDIK